MKYLLTFLLVLFFISPSVEDSKSFSQVMRDGFYNYITCLDRSFNYAKENIPLVKELSSIPYEKTYKKVMNNRTLTKHLVSSGETIDDIIKKYNYNISSSELDDFRKVVYKENENIISDNYNIQSGDYILVPSE